MENSQLLASTDYLARMERKYLYLEPKLCIPTFLAGPKLCSTEQEDPRGPYFWKHPEVIAGEKDRSS